MNAEQQLAAWIEEERHYAEQQFPGEQSSLLAFIATRIAALRVNLQQQWNGQWAQCLYRLCPGLLESSPATGWIHWESQHLEAGSILPQTELRVEHSSGAMQIIRIAEGIAHNALHPWKASALRKDAEGWLCFEIEAEQAVSMEEIWLDLRDEAGAHWGMYTRMRTAQQIVLAWDSSEGSSRWCGTAQELWGKAFVAPAHSWEALRNMLHNMDSECRLLMRLPSQCRQWTQLSVRFLPSHTEAMHLTCTPQLRLMPVVFRMSRAISWTALEGCGPLHTKVLGESISCVLRIMQRQESTLQELCVGPWTPMRKQEGARELAWLDLSSVLPNLQGTFVVEVEVCIEAFSSHTWNANTRVQARESKSGPYAKPFGTLLPYRRGPNLPQWGSLLTTLVTALLMRKPCGAAWKEFLVAVGSTAIPTWHPLWSIQEMTWSDDGLQLFLHRQRSPFGPNEDLVEQGRTLRYCECLEQFFAGVAPWLGRIQVKSIYGV